MLIVEIVLIAVLGSVLGSFFNVVIDRVPRKESIVFPASHCSSCGVKIPPWLNIPIVSYIRLKGKCRSCGAKFHWHHLAVEVLTPLLFLAIFFIYGLGEVVFYKYLVLFGFLIPIFFIDAFHRIIPLALSLPLIATGWIFALIPNSRVGIINSVVTSLVVFGFLYLLALAWEKVFHKEGLGGGDVVLLPGIAAYFGWISTPYVVILACLLGIVYFVVFIRKNEAFAFGNFIALAAVIWALGGEQLLQAIGLA